MVDPDPHRDANLPPNPSISARLADWRSHSARPWQFWYPQSGIRGGIICAALAIIILIIFVL